MKIFIAYRYTGEDHAELKETLHKLCAALEKAGHSHFCSFWKDGFFNENNYTRKQIMEHALKEIDGSDAVLAFVKSADRSEGMLLEVGYALAKGKKLILAIRNDVKTVFLREIAGRIIEFETIDELCRMLESLKL